MISNEETSGRNLYENIKYFLPLLKFIFASNCELNFAHPDDAVYDRLVIIPFNKEIKEEDRDIHLDEKLKKEKDIIFSIIIDTLKELVESNYDFHESKEAKEYICQRRMLLHSVEDFLDERAVLDIHGSVPSTELNKLYEEWCHINNIPAIGRNHLYKHVKDYNKEIRYCKVDSPNGRVNGFSNLRIKSAEEIEADNVKRNSESNAEPSTLTNSETTAE